MQSVSSRKHLFIFPQPLCKHEGIKHVKNSSGLNLQQANGEIGVIMFPCVNPHVLKQTQYTNTCLSFSLHNDVQGTTCMEVDDKG